MERADSTNTQDVLLHERFAGLAANTSGPTDGDNALALYIISLHNVSNVHGELLNGDAMLVRPRGTPASQLLAAVLGCELRQVRELAMSSGTWHIRELAEIDGHRVRFEPV